MTTLKFFKGNLKGHSSFTFSPQFEFCEKITKGAFIVFGHIFFFIKDIPFYF